MTFFVYKARNVVGDLVEGAQESASRGALAEQLMAQHLTLVEVREAKTTASVRRFNFLGMGLPQPKAALIDLMLFSYQLHTLLRTGVAMNRALCGLQEVATSSAMQSAIREVRETLEGGRELSFALSRFPTVFSPFYISMVRIGEATGHLDESLLRLFKHLEFERLMRDQVKSALRYPTFVVFSMLAAIGVINIFVIPSFTKVFSAFGADLPLVTKILLYTSKFTLAYWPFFLALLFAAMVSFRGWHSTRSGRLHWDQIVLRIPIAGRILHKAALAHFSRSFALGMKSGIPIMQAIANAAQTVGNEYIASRIESMRANIERGESLLKSATATGVFTPMVLQMVAVGEESGSVDNMMEEVGMLYQQEVEYELKTLGAQIEPILIVALGVLALILALGVFLPMWDLSRVAIRH